MVQNEGFGGKDDHALKRAAEIKTIVWINYLKLVLYN